MDNKDILIIKLKSALQSFKELDGCGLTQALLPTNNLLFIINSYLDSPNFKPVVGPVLEIDLPTALNQLEQWKKRCSTFEDEYVNSRNVIEFQKRAINHLESNNELLRYQVETLQDKLREYDKS